MCIHAFSCARRDSYHMQIAPTVALLHLGELKGEKNIPSSFIPSRLFKHALASWIDRLPNSDIRGSWGQGNSFIKYLAP